MATEGVGGDDSARDRISTMVARKNQGVENPRTHPRHEQKPVDTWNPRSVWVDSQGNTHFPVAIVRGSKAFRWRSSSRTDPVHRGRQGGWLRRFLRRVMV